MSDDIPERTFRAEDGRTYRVTLSPVPATALQRGARFRRAIVFERQGWSAWAPLYWQVDLSDLLEPELEVYWELALARNPTE